MNVLNKIRTFGMTHRVAIVGAALAVGSAASHAAADVSSVVTEIAGAGAPIATIGAAVLVVVVGTKIFKWIARAL